MRHYSLKSNEKLKFRRDAHNTAVVAMYTGHTVVNSPTVVHCMCITNTCKTLPEIFIGITPRGSSLPHSYPSQLVANNDRLLTAICAKRPSFPKTVRVNLSVSLFSSSRWKVSKILWNASTTNSRPLFAKHWLKMSMTISFCNLSARNLSA